MSAPASTVASTTIRVALLSDSVLFRSGLRRLFGANGSFLVVGEVTAPPVREQLRSGVPQILLVDAQIEGALEVCRELRLNGVRPWIILAGAGQGERRAVEALQDGGSRDSFLSTFSAGALLATRIALPPRSAEAVRRVCTRRRAALVGGWKPGCAASSISACDLRGRTASPATVLVSPKV